MRITAGRVSKTTGFVDARCKNLMRGGDRRLVDTNESLEVVAMMADSIDPWRLL